MGTSARRKFWASWEESWPAGPISAGSGTLNTDTGQGFAPLYQAVRDRLVHVHIKDCRSGAAAALPGTGELPVEAVVRRLLEDGYGGWFSFEWEKRWQPDILEPETAFPAYVRFMRRIAGE
mgnify:CR=1 FL=1